MKKILMIMLIMKTLLFSEEDNGYIWVSTTYKEYDNINLPNDEKEILHYDFKSGLPDLNSIIKIPNNSLLFLDINTIRNINFDFLSKLENKICNFHNEKEFFYYIKNKNNNECNSKNILENTQYIEKEIFAKILGYVSIEYGTFIFIKIIGDKK